MADGRHGERPFSLSRDEIACLRQALAAADFGESSVAAALGVPSIDQIRRIPGAVALGLTGEGTSLHTLLRLFVLGAPVEREAARRSLAPLRLERALAGGLVKKRHAAVIGSVKMVPVDGLVLAFDRELPGDAGEAADHVMGPNESARLLSRLTIRRPVDNALDLGTGCGYLAFLLARHARRVVASDINPRALAFTAFNAELNAVDNVTTVCGDAFAPLAGQSFDAVVSNPPFMISPESRLLYLSGGMKADGFVQRLAAEVPAFLRTGGVFQMRCNWVELADTPWQERLAAWFRAGGCDAWVLRSSSTEAEAYARGWMRLGVADGEPDPARLRAWLDYYAAEGIAAVGGGTVTLRKRAAPGWFRAFDAPPSLGDGCGAALAERLDALTFLAERASDDALLQTVLRVAPGVRLVQECSIGAEGWVQEQARVTTPSALGYVEEIDVYVGELIAACDGARPVGAAVRHAAARAGMEPGDVPEATLDIVRQLVEEGFLLPAGS
ncbi:MAG: methyltransferase [Myxococcales bacterium]|nr:methyltransferase [Myxococcales bacterium]